MAIYPDLDQRLFHYPVTVYVSRMGWTVIGEFHLKETDGWRIQASNQFNANKKYDCHLQIYELSSSWQYNLTSMQDVVNPAYIAYQDFNLTLEYHVGYDGYITHLFNESMIEYFPNFTFLGDIATQDEADKMLKTKNWGRIPKF